MAATAADGSKVDEFVGENSKVDEAMGGERSNADEAVGGEKSKMITLFSSDGERFEITHEAAAMSQTIQHMIEDNCVENGVPLSNVGSKILAMVIEYCNKHVVAAAARGTTSDNAAATGEQDDLRSFDTKFIAVDDATLFEIILAANYLDIKWLLDLSCQTVADKIKSMTVEEIRTMFSIENDFTPEEEQEVRRENQWAFE